MSSAHHQPARPQGPYAGGGQEQNAGAQGNPQKRGVCTRVYTTTPKEANSALRKVARGEAHQPDGSDRVHPRIAITCRSTRSCSCAGPREDIPGVRYKVIRGALDTAGVGDRRSGAFALRSEEAK